MKIDDIDINSEQIREILEKQPNTFLKWGITVIFIVIMLLFTATWLIKYPDVIQSQVIITTELPPQKEYAKTSGVINTILVKDNDLVKKNQPLAIIENTASYKDVFKLKAQYALFENSYIQYQLNKKLKPFSNEATANKYSISELNRRLKSLLSQKKLNKIELDFKQKDLNRNKSLYSKGVISLQEYENKQLEYAQNQRNYKNFEFSISQIKEAISNARKNSKGTEINKLKEEMILLKNVIQSFNQLKKSVKDWEYRYVLQSNINGKISFLNIWSINQTVNQGDLVFTIIPDDNSSYIAKLKTPAQNSGKMKIGQKVNIKLDNYPNTEFGILNGTVNNISLITDEKGLYAVDVKLSDKLITSYNKEIIFKQEMTGIAEIITEDLRLIERFFYQLKQLFQN